MSADPLSVVLRSLALVCLFQAAGSSFFLGLFGAWLPRSFAPIRRLAQASALLAVPLLVAHRALEAARMGDSYSALVDPTLQRLAWLGHGGLTTGVEIVGLALMTFGLTQPRSRVRTLAATLGAALASGAAVLTGHTRVHPQRLMLAPLLTLHLLVVAFWFGSLLPLILCCRRESRSAALAVLTGFSGVAGWLVPCLGLAGLVMAQTLMPNRAAWHSTYAAFVLTKFSAFLILLALAAWNRWRAVPAIARSPAPQAVAVLQRSITVEYLLMIAVLAVTATMTTFYSPQ